MPEIACGQAIEPDTQTDQMLVDSVRAGDDGAFELLFHRHKRHVARIAGRFFDKRETIEEVIQQTFTKAFFGLGDYSADRGPSFVAWLSRVAINACYDELRRVRRRPERPLSEVTRDEVQWLNSRLRTEDSESNLVSRDLANKLLAYLCPDDRLILTLMDGEDMPVKEIALITGWSISKIKVRAHRARISLRKVLQDLG